MITMYPRVTEYNRMRKRQIILVNFLEKNRYLLVRKVEPFEIKRYNEAWKQLTRELNKRIGAILNLKSMRQWKLILNEMKEDVRRRAKLIHAQNTGGGPKTEKDLTDLEVRLLSLLFKIVVVTPEGDILELSTDDGPSEIIYEITVEDIENADVIIDENISGLHELPTLRLLLNKRNSSSMDQVLSAFSEVAQLAVRKAFTLSGQPVVDLPQLFAAEDVFFVYGNERPSQDDFELEFEESKAIQQYKKTPGLRNGAGPKPKMPKKELNRTYESEESLLKKLSEDNNIILPHPLRNKYVVGRTIGDGNFAVVRLCKNSSTNKEYALKIIDKSKCKGKEDMIENEVKILRKVNHPNIMALIAEQDTKCMLYLVCEYIAGGDLFDAITVAQKFPEDQAALMINHLVSALAYLHNLNIVHRDVKPENLLVEVDGSRVVYLKLGDFGLACEVTRPLFTVCGTPTYVAPEILAESGYGMKIDVWAAGVILYILLCGYPPFVSLDNDQEKLFDSILSGHYDFPDEYWHDVSAPAKELIQNMLQLAPELRFSAEDVLDHPWLQLANC